MRRSIRVGLSPYLEGSQRGAELPRRFTVTPNILLYHYGLRKKTFRGLLKRVVVTGNIDFELQGHLIGILGSVLLFQVLPKPARTVMGLRRIYVAPD